MNRPVYGRATCDPDGAETTTEIEQEQASICDRATSIATVGGIIVALLSAWGTILDHFSQAERDPDVRQRELKKKLFRETRQLDF